MLQWSNHPSKKGFGKQALLLLTLWGGKQLWFALKCDEELAWELPYRPPAGSDSCLLSISQEQEIIKQLQLPKQLMKVFSLALFEWIQGRTGPACTFSLGKRPFFYCFFIKSDAGSCLLFQQMSKNKDISWETSSKRSPDALTDLGWYWWKYRKDFRSCACYSNKQIL